jgi:hypothetical protein
VHIDAIKPVWRADVAAEWFDQLDPKLKMLMHPVDKDTPPSGEGWIIQIICHHYNPYPTDREQLALDVSNPNRTDFGPIQFLTEKVLPRLNSPSIRLFGVHHVAVAWMTTEKDWTTEKGSQSNSTVPLLARASAPAGEGGAGAEGGMGGMMGGGMGQMMGQMAQMRGAMGGGAGMMGGPMGGMGEMMRGMGGMRGMMGGMGPMGGGMLSDAEAKKKMKTLTRTDFLLQFVWQPRKPEEQPLTAEERTAKLKEEFDKLNEAQKNNPAVKVSAQLEKDLESVSRQKSQQVDSAVTKAISALGAAAGGGGGAGAGTAAAPGAAAPAAGAAGAAAPGAAGPGAAPGAPPANPGSAPRR